MSTRGGNTEEGRRDEHRERRGREGKWRKMEGRNAGPGRTGKAGRWQGEWWWRRVVGRWAGVVGVDGGRVESRDRGLNLGLRGQAFRKEYCSERGFGLWESIVGRDMNA